MKLLITVRNLYATRGEWARRSEWSEQVLKVDVNELDLILERYVSEGHVASFTDHEGNRRYQLASTPIVRPCSFLS